MATLALAAPGVLASLSLLGCSGADSASSAAVERDSAGVVIVENEGPYEQWRVVSPPALRVGTVDGDSAYQFHRVRFAGRLTDGRVVVVDAGSSQIRWFTPDGRHRSSAGRSGAGPQEFSSFGSALLTRGDSLVIHDPQNQRVSWFTPQESFARDQPVRQVSVGAVTLVGVTPDRHLALAVATPVWDMRYPGLSYTRDSLSILLQSATALDTIVQRAGREGALWLRFDGGRPTARMQMTMPFAHQTFAAGSSDYLVLAMGVEAQLEMRDWSGALRRIARRPQTARMPLTDDDRERYVHHAVEMALNRGVSDPGATERNARDILAVIPEGHALPSFDMLTADPDGRIWLRDFAPVWSETPLRMWTAHGPDGRVVRRVALPAGLTVMHVRADFVTGVERDSLDVEYVVVYRIERDSGG